MKISFIKETFEVKIGGVIKPNLKKNCNTKKFIKAILCNLSMRMLKYIFFKFKFFFAHKKLKKPPSKVAQNSSNPLFFPYCPDCPNGPNRRIPVPKCI